MRILITIIFIPTQEIQVMDTLIRNHYNNSLVIPSIGIIQPKTVLAMPCNSSNSTISSTSSILGVEMNSKYDGNRNTEYNNKYGANRKNNYNNTKYNKKSESNVTFNPFNTATVLGMRTMMVMMMMMIIIIIRLIGLILMIMMMMMTMSILIMMILLFTAIDGCGGNDKYYKHYLYNNYTVGNLQTDRLLRALSLQHRWTVPYQQDVDDDNDINIDDDGDDDDDYNAGGGESSLKITSSSRHDGDGGCGGGGEAHYSKVTNPAENNGNLHHGNSVYKRDDIGSSRYEHDKSIVIDDDKSTVIDDKWGLHAYYDQMNLISTNNTGSIIHSNSNASSSGSSDHHRNQQYHVHSDDHNAAVAHDPSEIDIDIDNVDNDNNSIDHDDMKVDPAEIDIDIEFDVIVDNSGNVDVDDSGENGDGNSHQISTSIDCIQTNFDTNAIDLDD